MEFNIKKNSTLPILKMAVVKDGRNDYQSFMDFIETSSLFFSMVDSDTGANKIHMEPAGFVEKTFTDPNTPVEYYIYFKFQKKHLNKVGKFEGQFTLRNESGTLILPIREQLFINVLDSQGSEDINESFNLDLTAVISSGSTIINYILTSNTPAKYKTTVDFTHTLQTVTGDTVVITTGVTINSGKKTGSVTIVLPDADYNNLTQQNTFSNINIFPIGLRGYTTIKEETIFISPQVQNIVDAILTGVENEYISVGNNFYLKFVDPQIIDDAILADSETYIKVGEGMYLRFIDTPLPSPTNTPTNTVTPTVTSSEVPIEPTQTPTVTPTVTPTNTPTITPTITPSSTPLQIPSISARYLRWTLLKKKGSDDVAIQVADLVLVSNGSESLWNINATATSPDSTYNVFYETAQQLVDNDIFGKYCDISFGFGPTGTATIYIDNITNIGFDSYYYNTGDDVPARDPVSWTLEISYNNVDWILIDTVTDATITNDRRTPTQTFNILPTRNGLTPQTAGVNAYQIKTDFPFSTDGLYWIANQNISGGTPFQIYADMITDGGGWTLLMVNQDNSTWTHENALLYNQFNPVISGANYSIISYGDYLKGNGTTFQYMMEAYERNRYGGIWTTPISYTFVNTGNTQTGVTLDIMFDFWFYDNSGIEQRMPWYVPEGECPYITTSESPSSEWWGSLMTRPGCGFNPAPWISSQIQNPGIIWYWVRNTTPPPAPTPTPTSTSTQTPTPTPTVTPSSPKYYYLTNVYDCSNCQLLIPAVIIVFSHVPLTIDKFYQLQTSSFEILSVSAGPETNNFFNLTDSIGYDTCNESCGI